MKVADIMTTPVVVVPETATLDEVARVMLDNKVGCVPVVSADGQITGILTAFDFVPKDFHPPLTMAVWRGLFGLNIHGEPIHEIYNAVRSKRAFEVMTGPVQTVPEDADLDQAVNKLVVHKIDHLPVVRDGVPVGMLSRFDLLALLAEPAGSPGRPRPAG